jgi:hypothetical protein
LLRASSVFRRTAILAIAGMVAVGAMAGASSAGWHQGNDNKKDYRGCGDGYSRIYKWNAVNTDTAYLVDLNQDNLVCEGFVADDANGGGTAGHYNYTDNMSNK